MREEFLGGQCYLASNKKEPLVKVSYTDDKGRVHVIEEGLLSAIYGANSNFVVVAVKLPDRPQPDLIKLRKERVTCELRLPEPFGL